MPTLTASGCRFRLALQLLMLWYAGTACALDFRLVDPAPDGPQAGIARGLVISGDVLPGDADRLLALLRSQPADAWFGLGRVQLDIAGGDLGEALLLGEMLAPLHPHLSADADCAGACAIVWLAGGWRLLPRGKIGLQKPARPAARAAPSDAPPAYDTLPDQLRSYLLRQGVPAPLYERWLTSPATIYWLSEQDINATGTWPPYYYEKIHAQCPRLSASDESFHALRRCAARLAIGQRARALDKLLAGANDPWWNANKALFLAGPR